MDKTSSLKSVHIRPVSLADADACLAIYAPYVHSSHISFEYDVPTVEMYRERIQKTTSQYPWFVAEIDGEIVGFAYAGKFRERAAYGWALESSIYVSEAHQGAASASAKILYETLFTALRTLGTKQVLA